MDVSGKGSGTLEAGRPEGHRYGTRSRGGETRPETASDHWIYFVPPVKVLVAVPRPRTRSRTLVRHLDANLRRFPRLGHHSPLLPQKQDTPSLKQAFERIEWVAWLWLILGQEHGTHSQLSSGTRIARSQLAFFPNRMFLLYCYVLSISLLHDPSRPYEWRYEMRRDMQEIIPGLFLGPYVCSKNRDLLKQRGITHILCLRDATEKFIVKCHFREEIEYCEMWVFEIGRRLKVLKPKKTTVMSTRTKISSSSKPSVSLETDA